MPDDVLIRADALDRLRRIGGDALVRRMISGFRDTVSARVAAAREAAARSDPGGVVFAMHSLKSSAGNLGADALQALAEATEKAAAEERMEDVGLLLARLETTCEAVIRMLQTIEATLDA